MERQNDEKSSGLKTPRRRRWRVVLLFLVAMNAGFGLAVYFMKPTSVFADLDLAENFMRAIEIGNDDVDDEETSGYAVAFDLLNPEFQEITPFPEFLHFFDEQVRSFGFIQTSFRHKRGYGHFTARKVRFEVEYGGLGGVPTVVVYELTLAEKDGSYGISGYSLISTTKKSD
ncbi:MAG: hypothetical protein ACI97A_003382 [Planctomycetota bacterium]|jgi:hypothetical protein